MIKINTFIMAVIKTYCLFHFQTEICFFFVFFILSIFAPLPLKMELEYHENIKNSLNGIYYRFSEKYG